MEQPDFTVVVLAADRGENDAVASAAGVPCKALAQIQGKPLLLRILDTLRACNNIGRLILCGPEHTIVARAPELKALTDSNDISWAEPAASPSTSVEMVMGTLTDFNPVLITTADHGLLEPHMVTEFCTRARLSHCDVVVGLVAYSNVKAEYPDLKKTILKFRDGDLCGCNLFAFLTPRGRKAASFWRKAESQRKHPARLFATIGWLTMIRYALGGLSLAEALDRLSARTGVRVGAVLLPYPEASVDVDTAEDLAFVRELLEKKL